MIETNSSDGSRVSKVQIIAEIGINHQKSLDTAKKLADIARECGADVVKTQLENPTEYCLTYDETLELYRYCESIGMPFACTAFDAPTLRWVLANCNIPFIKMASTLWQNPKLYNIAGATDLPVIQSIVAPIVPVREVKRLLFLHVVSEYPTPIEHCNLKRLKEPWCDGLSDHSGNPLIPALAVALGAKIIECHLTLDRNQYGPDHKASLDPEGFAQMVRNVRQAQIALT